MVTAMSYRASWTPGSAMAGLVMALLFGVALAGAMVATAMVATMLTPVVVGCCVAAGAAVVAALPAMGCVGLIIVFAIVFKP